MAAHKPFRRWRKNSAAKKHHDQKMRLYEKTYTSAPVKVKKGPKS